MHCVISQFAIFFINNLYYHYYCVITIAIAVLGNFQLWEHLLAIAVVTW